MRPVDVQDRVEFLSDAWVEAARTFAAARVAEQPELAGVSFSLCESFANAPASVAGPDGRAAWHLRLDAGSVEAGRGEIAETDIRVTGEYQPVLAVAQAVNAAGSDAFAWAQRETVHRHGAA